MTNRKNNKQRNRTIIEQD